MVARAEWECVSIAMSSEEEVWVGERGIVLGGRRDCAWVTCGAEMSIAVLWGIVFVKFGERG